MYIILPVGFIKCIYIISEFRYFISADMNFKHVLWSEDINKELPCSIYNDQKYTCHKYRIELYIKIYIYDNIQYIWKTFFSFK